MFFMIVYIFLHLMTFDLILLALKLIFIWGNMQTLIKGMSRVLTLQNICSKNPFSRVFMRIYILLHLVTFDLILLALKMILHLATCKH